MSRLARVACGAVVLVATVMGLINAAPTSKQLFSKDKQEYQIAISQLEAVPTDQQKQYLPEMIEKLQSSDETVRRRAATVLGQLHAIAAPAIPALTAALKDPDAQVRENAASALGNIGGVGPTTIAALRDLLHGPDPYASSQAAIALGRLSGQHPEIVQMLLEALKSPQEGTGGGAANALINIAGKSPPAPLVDSLMKQLKTENLVARSRIVIVLDNLRIIDPAMEPTLQELLKDRDPQMRGRAAQILSKLPTHRSTSAPLLTNALGDANSEAQGWAMNTLESMGKDAKPSLVNALKSSDEELRRKAAELLMKMDVPRCALLPLLRHPDPLIRANSARLIPSMCRLSVDGFTEVVALTQDPIARVRAESFNAIVDFHLSSQSAARAARQGLRDRSTWVRQSAAYALGHISETPAQDSEAVLTLFRDADSEVRTSAMKALGHLLDPRKCGGKRCPPLGKEIVDGILRLVEDPDPLVQMATARAFAQSGSRIADEVRPRLRSESPDVRQAADQAILKIQSASQEFSEGDGVSHP